MTIQTFPMPDVGEGLTEAEILTWHVAVGDTLTVNQIMVEIETAKAAVELPSPYAGLVTALLVEPGVTVDVGTPIISIDTDPGGAVRFRSPAAPLPRRSEDGGAKIGEMTADGRIATLVGYVVGHRRPPGRRPRKGGSMRPVDDLGFDLASRPEVGRTGTRASTGTGTRTRGAGHGGRRGQRRRGPAGGSGRGRVEFNPRPPRRPRPSASSRRISGST